MGDVIRILHVLNGLGSGGAETVIMNWYRHINREKVQFDFLIRSTTNLYADEISALGGRVFIMPPYPSHYLSNKKETECFFKEHAGEYLGIHVHGNALLYTNVFSIAQKNGIKHRVFHSHSISTDQKYVTLHAINRLRIHKMATDYFACSVEAGKWAFASQPFIVVKNGIAVRKYVYNEAVRNSVRNTLGITDETVYGHVGRFVDVKNHTFLLGVFKEIVNKCEKSMLLLLGDGELFDSVQKEASKLGIKEKVRFLGRKDNIGEYMNAMDVFLFPSLYEGLGIVAVEAQAAGLPVIISDTITREVALTDRVKYLPLSSYDEWVENAIEMSRWPRDNTQEAIKKAGYDIDSSARYLEDYYCSWK